MSLILLTRKNYLALITGLPGSTLFQHAYAKDDAGNEIDIMQGGQVACAYVASSILHIVGWIDRPHATVKSTVTALKADGWTETMQPVPGALVLWPASKEMHEHIGFYLNENHYVSNSTDLKVPIEHGSTLNDGRQPYAYLVHDKLTKKTATVDIHGK